MPSALSSDGPVRVGVVFGGVSGEHPISIRSARTVVGALRSGANADRYRVSCFYIDRRGGWWPPAVADPILGGASPDDALPGPSGQPDSPAPSAAGFRGFPDGALAVEVWFPVLHGPNGEDGTIQGLFTLMAVPFVGSGVLGSAVGMDKQAMKAAFAAAGLPQVPYVCLESHDLAGSDADVDGLLTRLETSLGYPCFVKPANMGSSVGISKATERASLLEGLRAAAAIDPRLVVEKGVSARELECAVLGTRRLRASVVGEIRFDADWYDYETKYSDGLSHTVIPADLPGEISERARSLALAACRAVGAAGLARVDFFYEAEAPAAVGGPATEGGPATAGGRLWLNEINTLPGFTSQSMYPMLWEASGLPLPDLVHELVQGARESHAHAIVTTGVSG